MSDLLDRVMKETGLIFDTTYSGKAFYGMLDHLNNNNVSGDVLFGIPVA